MADLLTTTERQNISGIIDDVFDTFKRSIVVYKEPTKTVSDVDLDFMFGYNAKVKVAIIFILRLLGLMAPPSNTSKARTQTNHLSF